MNILSVDIDGTIVDVSARYNFASFRAKDGSPQFWNIFLNSQYFHLDRPIIPARDFLCLFHLTNPDVKIIYLSGRNARTTEETKSWLRQHDFPDGEVILRNKGPTKDFKRDQFFRLKKLGYTICAHIGDSDDDCDAAK